MRLIDAEAVREKAHKLPNGYNWGWFHKCVDEMIDTAPTIDTVKHGKWEFEPGIMYCSVCGWIFSYENGLEEEYEYCPHCGAMMERSESDEHSD